MKRTGILLGVLGAVLVAAAWYMLVMQPINGRIADAQSELDAAKDQELTLRTQLARLQKIQDAELSYISAIGALDVQIPSLPELASLNTTLSDLANQSSVVWQGVTYGVPALVPEKDYYGMPLSIRVEGQFFEVLGYLYSIADMERLVRIDGVSVSPTLDDNNFTVLDVTITASAFTTSDLAIAAQMVSTTTTSTTTTTVPETTTTTVAETTTTTSGGG